ncbi:hypothetical protein [Spirosoma pollinicola]|uniref:hypothetical protein n=1 Tax=Spirosoma pollinicola TaxID=2057025 RepID=UPI0012FDDC2E|nr:hypothetical protein [Spirosoma pollinicola]
MNKQVAYDWVRVQLPTDRLTYTDYIKTISGLNRITDNPVRTVEIVTAAICQAKAFGYSSEWVQSEIKLEAQAEAAGDRVNWLLAILQHAGADDEALDQYNERINRFQTNG